MTARYVLLWIINIQWTETMNFSQQHLMISLEKEGPEKRVKQTFPLRFGRYSEIRTRDFEFCFNLNREKIHERRICPESLDLAGGETEPMKLIHKKEKKYRWQD
jgi:hypothetical protein